MVELVMVDQSRDQPLLRLEENRNFHSTQSFRLRPDSTLSSRLWLVLNSQTLIWKMNIILYNDLITSSAPPELAHLSGDEWESFYEWIKAQEWWQMTNHKVTDNRHWLFSTSHLMEDIDINLWDWTCICLIGVKTRRVIFTVIIVISEKQVNEMFD